MTDIVKKLRGPIDEKEDYFISQWPGEEPKTHDAVRFQAADEIERLRAGVDAGLKAATYTNEYKDPVSAHAEFMTCARVSLAIRAALGGE